MINNNFLGQPLTTAIQAKQLVEKKAADDLAKLHARQAAAAASAGRAAQAAHQAASARGEEQAKAQAAAADAAAREAARYITVEVPGRSVPAIHAADVGGVFRPIPGKIPPGLVLAGVVGGIALIFIMTRKPAPRVSYRRRKK